MLLTVITFRNTLQKIHMLHLHNFSDKFIQAFMKYFLTLRNFVLLTKQVITHCSATPATPTAFAFSFSPKQFSAISKS